MSAYPVDLISAERMERFFAAARRFFRAAPWKAFQDEMPLAVDAAGLEEACLVVLGEADESRGFMLFETIDDYLDFLDAADEGEGPIGPLLHFSFVPKQEVDGSILQAIDGHGWEIPAPDSVPVLLALDEESEQRELDEQDFLLASAFAEAISDLLAAHPVLDVEEELRFSSSHDALPAVELTLPHPAFAGAEEELIEGFVEEEQEQGESEDLARTVATHALRFKELSQADALVWSAAEVEEFLLFHVPRQVAVTADDMVELPLVFGRLLEFVGTGYESMDRRRIDKLRDHVEELLGRFRLATADPARWAPAKQVAMRMLERGIDPADTEAVAAIVAEIEAEPKQAARAEPKTGRNDPCPCGSGKKHKKCCGA